MDAALSDAPAGRNPRTTPTPYRKEDAVRVGGAKMYHLLITEGLRPNDQRPKVLREREREEVGSGICRF